MDSDIFFLTLQLKRQYKSLTAVKFVAMNINFTKRILAAGLFLLAGLSAVRAEEARLIITTTNGTVAQFLIADSPVITYQDNLLTVTGGGSEISVEADAVGSFDFVPSEDTGVSIITADGSMFSGLKPGDPVLVYTADGKLAASFKADESTSVSVDLSPLPAGIYIVRTPGASFKIKKQ